MSAAEMNIIALLGGLIVLIGYAVFFIFSRHYRGHYEEENLKKRISEIAGFVKVEAAESLSLIKEKAVQETFLQSKLPKIEGLKQWLQHADLNVKPTLFVIVSGALGLSISISLIIFLHGAIILSLLLGIFASFVLPWILVSLLIIKKKNEFLEEFPVALDIMRRALRAGYSADRSLEMVSEQQVGRIGKIFRIVSEKMRLGEAIEVVLSDIANRIGIDEFRMLAIVLVLQRETGGSLAEATENFAKIVRARQSIRKKVKALSAEVRVTAIILASLPFFILGAVFISSPHYLDSLFFTEKGHILLIIGGLMLSTGIAIIIRMAYKEIY